MGLLSQASRALFAKEPEVAVLKEYKPNSGKPVESVKFQYWPETITDSKSPTYDRRFAPGGSHPIIQFQNGGEREISFAAMFTFEESPDKSSGVVSDLLTGNFNIGLTANSDRKDTYKGGIESVLTKLRYFTYPDIKYGVTYAPPLCVIFLPNSGIKSFISAGGNATEFKDSFVGVMTQCNVTYQAFHRSGHPRIVEVQLAFLETIQVGDGWSYVGSDALKASGSNVVGSSASLLDNIKKLV